MDRSILVMTMKLCCESPHHRAILGHRSKSAPKLDFLLLTMFLDTDMIVDRRFLRARTFDPEGAFKQFSETEDWRKENRLDEYYDVIDVEEFETTRELVRQQKSTFDIERS